MERASSWSSLALWRINKTILYERRRSRLYVQVCLLFAAATKKEPRCCFQGLSPAAAVDLLSGVFMCKVQYYYYLSFCLSHRGQRMQPKSICLTTEEADGLFVSVMNWPRGWKKVSRFSFPSSSDYLNLLNIFIHHGVSQGSSEHNLKMRIYATCWAPKNTTRPSKFTTKPAWSQTSNFLCSLRILLPSFQSFSYVCILLFHTFAFVADHVPLIPPILLGKQLTRSDSTTFPTSLLLLLGSQLPTLTLTLFLCRPQPNNVLHSWKMQKNPKENPFSPFPFSRPTALHKHAI